MEECRLGYFFLLLFFFFCFSRVQAVEIIKAQPTEMNTLSSICAWFLIILRYMFSGSFRDRSTTKKSTANSVQSTVSIHTCTYAICQKYYLNAIWIPHLFFIHVFASLSGNKGKDMLTGKRLCCCCSEYTCFLTLASQDARHNGNNTTTAPFTKKSIAPPPPPPHPTPPPKPIP